MKTKPLLAGPLVLHVAVLAYSAVLHEASIKITSSSTDFEVQYWSQWFFWAKIFTLIETKCYDGQLNESQNLYVYE